MIIKVALVMTQTSVLSFCNLVDKSHMQQTMSYINIMLMNTYVLYTRWNKRIKQLQTKLSKFLNK
jgi:queuine/archaeosine tRNA-ribosyltransferase